MSDSSNKFFVDGDNIKFNIHTNFCGRKGCVYSKNCGQYLSNTEKHRLISQGLIPQIDTHTNVTCFKTQEDLDKDPPDSGCVPGTYIADWPAQELEK